MFLVRFSFLFLNKIILIIKKFYSSLRREMLRKRLNCQKHFWQLWEHRACFCSNFKGKLKFALSWRFFSLLELQFSSAVFFYHFARFWTVSLVKPISSYVHYSSSFNCHDFGQNWLVKSYIADKGHFPTPQARSSRMVSASKNWLISKQFNGKPTRNVSLS